MYTEQYTCNNDKIRHVYIVGVHGKEQYTNDVKRSGHSSESFDSSDSSDSGSSSQAEITSVTCMVGCDDIVGQAITLSPTDNLDGLFVRIRDILDGCAPAGPQLTATCMPVELPGLFMCDYECTASGPPSKRETSNTIVLSDFNANSLKEFLNTIFDTCPNDALTVNSCQNS